MRLDDAWFELRHWALHAERGAQSRAASMVEALTNVAIGYGVAVVAQLVILPAYGAVLSLQQNIEIGLWFTVVSVARSYVLRRLFDRRAR
jgi:hypothetical protein